MRLIGRRRSTRGALAAGLLVGCGYTAIVVGYSALPGSDVSLTGPLWYSFLTMSLLSLGTLGVPVVLRLAANLRSPLFLAAGILLFWHVLVYVPPIGTGQGDSPGFIFVFAFAPFYLLAYGLLAAVEFTLTR